MPRSTKDQAPYLEANALIQIPTSKGLVAANVYPDETQPKFMNCELDMDSNLLTLKFDEPVRALSFDAARVELRDAHATENKTEFVVLSSGSTSSTDAYHLRVELGERTCLRSSRGRLRTDSQFNLLWRAVRHGAGLRRRHYRRRESERRGDAAGHEGAPGRDAAGPKEVRHGLGCECLGADLRRARQCVLHRPYDTRRVPPRGDPKKMMQS